MAVDGVDIMVACLAAMTFFGGLYFTGILLEFYWNFGLTNDLLHGQR